MKNRVRICLSLKHGIITSLDMPVERAGMLSNKLGKYKQIISHNYENKTVYTYERTLTMYLLLVNLAVAELK